MSRSPYVWSKGAVPFNRDVALPGVDHESTMPMRTAI